MRTRLRQAPPPNQPARYTGLLQTFQLVIKEEGFATLYSGLSPHLLRVVPNAITLYIVYESMLSLFSKEVQVNESKIVQ